MLLRIQHGESLHSYIDRNIALNWKNPSGEFFKKLSKTVLTFSEIKSIASAMGWLGCRGLNRLLHFHTEYPMGSVFKNNQNMSYSQDAYISQKKWLGARRQDFKFCPDCIREDIHTLGFSFWHRLHHENIGVCAKHNVILERHCPFCNRGFYFDSHGLEVMWSGCEGRSLSESLATANYDLFELKRSKFLCDLYSCSYHISEQAVLRVLYDKLSKISHESLKSCQNAEMLVKHIELAVSEMSLKNFHSDRQLSMNGLCFEAIVLAYNDFDSFLNDMTCHNNVLRPIDSLWGAYKPGDGFCNNYITDDLS